MDPRHAKPADKYRRRWREQQPARGCHVVPQDEPCYKARNEPVTSFLPIARSLMNMDTATRERMKCKLDICYVMAKEGIALSKYTALYDLESQHDVDLGVAYRNDV